MVSSLAFRHDATDQGTSHNPAASVSPLSFSTGENSQVDIQEKSSPMDLLRAARQLQGRDDDSSESETELQFAVHHISAA